MRRREVSSGPLIGRGAATATIQLGDIAVMKAAYAAAVLVILCASAQFTLTVHQGSHSRSQIDRAAAFPIAVGRFTEARRSDAERPQEPVALIAQAEVVWSVGLATRRMDDLEALSQASREAFEAHEQESQRHHVWPGIKSKPVPPPRVLEAQ
jgi:hypothetical protein